MRTEDVLAAIATGLWRWDNASGIVSLDAEAARLLGLPAEPVRLTEAAVRSRFHPVDWNEIDGVVNLAVAEGTLAEARLRIMDGNGRVIRTVRSRSKPLVEGNDYQLVGTLQEVAEQVPGTAARTPITGDWRRSREAFLLDAGRALAEARSTAEVLRVAASLSMPGFSPDGLAVFGVAGDRLTVIGHHGHSEGDEGPFSSMSLDTDYPAAEAARTGRAIYLPTPEEYLRRFPVTWPLAQRFGRRSWAFVPLVVAGRTMGAWMAAFKHPVAFTPDERSVLTTVARMLAQALARAGVAESERELSLGLQRTMMPVLGPGIPGIQVAARYVPTGGGLQVGGDWYDMIRLPGGTSRTGGRGSGRIALVIGDVQGHDVRAAGLMGQLRIALRAYASEGHRPDAVLSRASRFLYGITDGDDGEGEAGPRFATCLYLEVDLESGTVDIARAGHPDPAVRMNDGTVLLRPTAGGLPLGIDPDTDYPTTRLTLEPGETLMICTDGLLETGGHDLDTGWERVRALLESHDGEDLEALADTLVEAVHGPGSHYTTGPLADRREDDIAVLLLSRRPAGTLPEAPRRTLMTIAQAEPERIAAAREQVRQLLHDWRDEDQRDSAVLMVSEMVTNVLVHTDGDALLVAEVACGEKARRLRVEVSDGSDELPHKRHPGEMASSGRGLVLMEMLADAWGVDPRGDGKAIWFELNEPDSEQGCCA
ncbi:serine phosphatase RsbU (regulator of sigma subunit)/anti-sigma regulatory factor (Ser/Thr protein kinase) [Streptomyces sp. PvR006]|uniref:SpoIIE family protein phosphatase n=1 Tax=unclassified Streptomyces TaxID=2593676 RepID=UPI001AE5C2E7|nr:SpoIIE family protein phosphatase [Streptomyces sp. PvR006]MBP2583261.1 serine phosphatase RsbU (regulator of sigma subunit)/anti-sigma regulatory factor (Ser/Thr protein kinase) [Streptomyces sp. PvR006]